MSVVWVEWLPPDDIDSNVNVVQQNQQKTATAAATTTPPVERVLSVSVCVRRNRWPLACYGDRKMARFCPRFWSELRFVSQANVNTTCTCGGVDCITTFPIAVAGAVGKKSTIRRKRYRRVVAFVRLSSSADCRTDRSRLPSLLSSLCNRVGGECAFRFEKRLL